MSQSGTPVDALETALLELQAVLATAQPDALPRRAQAVRDGLAALADWLARTPANQRPAGTTQRAQALGGRLAATRDQLARLMALTQQQASALLPPIDPVTYGPASAANARIYRSQR